MSVKIADIARELGVSSATISRALRYDPKLSPDTVEKVFETARMMNYQSPAQKRFAFNQSKRQMRSWCLLFPYPVKEYSYTRLDLLLIDTLEHYCHDKEILLQITRLDTSGGLPGHLQEQRFNGFLVKSNPLPSRKTCPELYSVPCIMLFDFADAPESAMRVQTDSELAAEMIFHRLADELNCEEILVISDYNRDLFELTCEYLGRLRGLEDRAKRRGLSFRHIALPDPQEVVRLTGVHILSNAKKTGVVTLRQTSEERELIPALEQSGFKIGKDFEAVTCEFDTKLMTHPKVHYLNLRGPDIVKAGAELLYAGWSIPKTIVNIIPEFLPVGRI